MSVHPFPGPNGPRKTARVLTEEPKAAEQNKQANGTADELDDAMGECRMLRLLQRRLSQFDVSLFPLSGDHLLLSHPSGFTRTVPNLRAARELLRNWEGR